MDEERRRELLGHTHLGRHVLGGSVLFFDESKINRANDGKFATKGGAGGKSADAASESEINSGGGRFVSGKSGGRFVSSSPRGSSSSRIDSAVSSLGSTASKAVKAAGRGLAAAVDYVFSRNDEDYKDLEDKFGRGTANAIVASGLASSMGMWLLVAALPVAASAHIAPWTAVAKGLSGKSALPLLAIAAYGTSAAHDMAPGLAHVTRYPGRIAAHIAFELAGIKKGGRAAKSKEDTANHSADFADGDEKTLSDEKINELGKEYAKKKAAELMNYLFSKKDVCKKMAQAMIDEGQCTAEELREYAEKILAKAKG